MRKLSSVRKKSGALSPAGFDLSTLGGRLRYFMESSGLSVEDVAAATDASEKSVYRWLAGSSRPYDKYLRRLSSASGVSFAWLASGSGAMADTTSALDADIGHRDAPATASDGGDRTAHSTADLISYPFLAGSVAGGASGGAQYDEGDLIYLPHELVASWNAGAVPGPNEAYWTRIRGTSMEPWLHEGMPIFVVRTTEVVDGARYVVYLDDVDREIVKRIERRGGGILHLISDHPAHAPIRLRYLEEVDEGDMYEDLDTAAKVKVRVRGRVIFPSDTAHAIFRTFVPFVAESVRPGSR